MNKYLHIINAACEARKLFPRVTTMESCLMDAIGDHDAKLYRLISDGPHDCNIKGNSIDSTLRYMVAYYSVATD